MFTESTFSFLHLTQHRNRSMVELNRHILQCSHSHPCWTPLPCWKMDSVTEVTSSNRALMGGKWSVSLAKICTIWNSRTSHQTLWFCRQTRNRLIGKKRENIKRHFVCVHHRNTITVRFSCLIAVSLMINTLGLPKRRKNLIFVCIVQRLCAFRVCESTAGPNDDGKNHNHNYFSMILKSNYWTWLFTDLNWTYVFIAPLKHNDVELVM